MPFSNTPLPELDEPQRGDVVVLADASVEGEDIAASLRARGYTVFDVPMALIEARVASEEPRIVIVDIDQVGAIERVRRLRDQPSGRQIEVLCLGDPLRAAELADVSLADNVFERPVDVVRLVERVVHVASPAGGGFSGRGTTPPPMYAPRPSAAPAPDSVPPISDFPRGVDPLEVGSFLEDGADGSAALGALAGNVRLSPELAQQIAAAEARIHGQLDGHSSSPPAPEDGDCIVPPDLLAQLDEPLDALEEAEGTGGLQQALAQAGSSSGTGSMAMAAYTPAPRLVGTGAGTPLPEGTSAIAAAPRSSPGFSATSEPPAAMVASGSTSTELFVPSAILPASSAAARSGSPALGIRLGELLGIKSEDVRRAHELPARSTGAESQTMRGEDAFQPAFPPTPLGLASLASAPLSAPVRFQEPRDIAGGRPVFDIRTIPPLDPLASLKEPSAMVAPPSVALSQASGQRDDGVSPAAQSVRTATARDSTSMGAVFGEGEGLRPLGRAIAARTSGCLAIVLGEGTRRVVLLDGDIVTAASEIADESLVAFLSGRGDLDRDAAARLAGKLPPSGRHAGAALIAQGFLASDDLWPVLRAHAEWLIGKILASGPGGAQLEPELPSRLKAEPGVFGGATGAEVFVETARRVLDPARSLAALGERARLDVGNQKNLLSECALSNEEEAAVRGATGKTVSELCSGVEPEFASVVRALCELDVLGLVAPIRKAAEPVTKQPDLIDEDATRAKIKAKMALVQEGDYFALLGVERSATSYEIRRAYLDLRKSFEPTRLLTARTSDLFEDVQLILEVVEEAFEILRDSPRRERYKRAIEAGPPD